MRILALVTDAFGGAGGIAQYNRHFLSALVNAEGVSEVIVLPRAGTGSSERIPARLRQFAPQKGRLRYAARALACLITKGPFDVIFCGHIHMASLAVLLGRVFRVPVWLQLYGIETWERPSGILRWSAERAALVTAISRHTRRRFLTWANIAHDRVKVLPCMVDEKFKPGPKPGYLLQRYGLQDRKILLTVSRLSSSERYKGHDRVIAVFPELRKRHPNLVYVVAGDGDDRERLEKLAKEKGVQEFVHFIGKVQDTELPDIYRMADVFVMPSTGEGFGIVFLEALACGRPVIGGATDGSVDPLHDGKLGLVLDPMDTKSLEAAILESLRRPLTAVHCVVRHFSNQNFQWRVQKIIATLLPC